MGVDPDQISRRKRVVIQHPAGDQVHEEQVVEDVNLEQRQMVHKVSQLVWLIIGGLEGAIAFRMFLQVIAANPNNGFTWFVYRLTDLFVWPFLTITANPSFQGHVLEITSIIAMFVYLVVGFIVVRLIWLIFYHAPTKRVSIYDREDV